MGDLDIPVAVDLVDGSFVGAALVHRDLARRAVLTDGLFEEPPCRSHVTVCRQKKVDSFSSLSTAR